MSNEVRTSNYVLVTNNYSCLDRLVIKRQENTTQLGLAGPFEKLKSGDMIRACSHDLQILLLCICYAEYEEFRRYVNVNGEIEKALMVVRQLMEAHIKRLFVDSQIPAWKQPATFRFGFLCSPSKPEVEAVEKFITWFNA